MLYKAVCSRMASTYSKVLTVDTMNKAVLNAQYAVRGEIPRRAEQLHYMLQSQPGTLPFNKIVQCNIGNPQELGQAPLTFIRQVAALVEYPELLAEDNRELVSKLFPADAIERAQTYRASGMASTGVYTHSQGLPIVRKNIANFIQERDGYPSDPNNIFLTNGASGAVHILSQVITSHQKSGVLIPVPQYPLYTATMTLLQGVTVPYYLDEDNDWALSIKELERAHKAAVNLGIEVKSLVIINPGNPTGSCLTEGNIHEIIDYCHTNRLVILADEVYQTNFYTDSLPFCSFKKALNSMGPKYEGMELASMHSVSKGFVGECGKRSGYMELEGFDPLVKDEIYKVSSIQLCPNVPGQIVMDCMVKPPAEGEPSFPLYEQERNNILGSLKRRATMLVGAFNDCEGVKCNRAAGAMYAFPRISLPPKSIHKAKEEGMEPDTFYCLKLLEATGVCTVAGSGFRQIPGTFHLRTTFLPVEEELPEVIALLKKFHADFMDTYR